MTTARTLFQVLSIYHDYVVHIYIYINAFRMKYMYFIGVYGSMFIYFIWHKQRMFYDNFCGNYMYTAMIKSLQYIYTS